MAATTDQVDLLLEHFDDSNSPKTTNTNTVQSPSIIAQAGGTTGAAPQTTNTSTNADSQKAAKITKPATKKPKATPKPKKLSPAQQILRAEARKWGTEYARDTLEGRSLFPETAGSRHLAAMSLLMDGLRVVGQEGHGDFIRAVFHGTATADEVLRFHDDAVAAYVCPQPEML